MKSGFILVAAGLAIAAWWITRATSSSSSAAIDLGGGFGSPTSPTPPTTDNLFSSSSAGGGGALTLQQALAQGGPAVNPIASQPPSLPPVSSWSVDGLGQLDMGQFTNSSGIH